MWQIDDGRRRYRHELLDDPEDGNKKGEDIVMNWEVPKKTEDNAVKKWEVNKLLIQ